MANRYSRVEKGKWTADSSRSAKRLPVKIPRSDNAALIEENKLTLIGRVTNPAVQKTQWVELGPVLDKDVDHGRIRILIDGLRKLEMRLPIELPSGEVITVDLEYERLEKHCFICYSLCHEKETCPLNRDRDNKWEIQQGISQHNTLKKLEEHRRKQDTRRSTSTLSRNRGGEGRDNQTISHRSAHSRLQESERRRYPDKERDRSFYSREDNRRSYEDSRREREGSGS
ncbi:unnamed protein product [Brassica rapa]|uniref:Zinc knuckle CX2CX4HX4C domain-containing protein n=1 Tax=Brassica campestris TaxID=3711 RepID=A0A3P6BG68_BRACM|nr:unnamed protein product [Brassica rapa]VDC95471.1 unnamed protein product [Brassica rapa]